MYALPELMQQSPDYRCHRFLQFIIHIAAENCFLFSDTVFWILYLLCKAEKSYSQNELAEELCIAKQTVNSAVAKLAKDGYVELISRKGLRQGKYIALTETGKARCRESVLPLLNAEKRSMEKLGGGEAALLLKLFQTRLQYLTEEVS